MFNRILVIILVFFAVNNPLKAEQCSAVFPDGIQNNKNDGEITFAWGSQVTNSPDNILASNNVINDGSGNSVNSCGSANCSHSGNKAKSANHTNFPGGSDVDIPYQQTLSLVPGHYDEFKTGSEATVKLSAGDYTFKDDFTLGSSSKIEVVGAGVVRIFVKGEITTNYNAKINANGSGRNLLLYSKEEIEIGSKSEVSAFIFTKDDITLSSGAVVNGAVSGGEDIELISASTINFISATPDFGDFCSANLTQAIASYRFDETEYSDTPNEVIDSIGSFHGQAKNSEPVEGKICNAIDLSVSGINDYAVLDENILTGNTDFSISLWARTNKATNQSLLSGAGASNNELLMWFTSDTSFKPFLKNTSNGSITTPSISDDKWHHLVWTRADDQSCIFVDKNLKGCVTQSTLPLNIQSLILGQEQDSVGGSFVASQAFNGLIDELLVFDSAISSAEISTIFDNQKIGLNYDGSSRNCPVAVFPLPVLDLHFDETAWSAPNSIIDISGNNYHANAVNVTPTLSNQGAICRAADLSKTGTSDYITLDSAALNNRSNFSISLWYKTGKQGNQSIISGASPSSFNELIFWFTNSSQFSPHIKSNAQSIATDSVFDDNWHHLVWTRSNTKNKFYRDGVLQGASVTLPSGVLNITNLILGQEQDSLGGSFEAAQSVEGLVDELLIFNKALTATQVQSVYKNQSLGLNFDASPRNCPVLPVPLFNMQFDEASWSGQAGEVIDETGNFHGQALGGASTDNISAAIIGNPGTCRYGVFDGVDDYVEVADNAALNLSTELTITAWIKPESLPSSGYKTILSKDENYEFHLDSSGEVYWWWSTHSFSTSDAGIVAGHWYHVAITYTSGKQSIYVNGVEKGSKNFTGNLPVNNDPLQIGQDQHFNGRYFHGLIDEVRLYQGALTQAEVISVKNETHPCAAIDHFEINHDGQGLTCQAEEITIKACADVTCTSLYMGTSDVALSINGTFEKTVTVTGGSTTTNFSYLDSITPATLSLDENYTCKNGASSSCNVAFAEAGFILDMNGSDDVASCDASKYLAIKAVKLSDNGVSCAPAFTGNQSLNLAFNYLNPTTGTKVPKLSGTNMAASGVNQNRTIIFNGNGEASLPVQYDDAGQLSFSVAEVVSSGVSSATLTKVFYPSKLVVSTPLSSTNSSGTVKQVAGKEFPISIIAQCQGGTVTGNYSPQSTPQPNSTLQLSVQQKEPIANNGVLTIDSVSGSANIAATNLATTTWGNTNQTAVNFNAKYSEVGIINLAAQDLNYFGNAINSAGYSSAGRFIPDHFDVVITSNSFGDTCTTGTTDFTYIGQPFSYLLAPELLITAKNKSGQPTKNYTESGYQKLEFDDITRTFPTVDSTKDGLDLTDDSINNPPKMAVLPEFFSDASMLASLNDGVMKYTFKETDSFSYTKNANSKVDPFPMEYDIIIETIKDSDDVNASASLADDEPSSNTVSPTGVNLRFGRWNIENAFGPETSPLPMPMAIQYWNGSVFVVNSHDNCTKPNIANEQNTGAIWGGGLTAWQYRLLDAATGINEVITPTDIAQITAPSPLITVSDGIYRNFVFPSPSSGKVGSLNLEYEVPAWLKYDWQNNGNFDDNPSAVATFGQFRGNDRIIYQREVH